MTDVPSLLIDEPVPVLRGRATRMVVVALAVGLLSEWLAHPALFDGARPGIGASLVLAVPIATLLLGEALTGVGPSRAARWYLPAALVAVALTVVRSAPALVALDVIAAICLVSLGLYRYRDDGGELTLFDHVRVVAWVPAAAACHPVLFLTEDVRWKTESQGSPRVRAVLRGLVIAVIPVVVFGALLSSADPVFERILTAPFRVRVDSALEIAVVVAGVAWMLIGVVRYAVGRTRLEVLSREVGHLGLTETVAVLGSVALLFATFVIVQFTYLFGGVGTIRATGGLTRAEYYRQGFFQLVTVTALVALFLLALDWWHRPEGDRPARWFAGLSLTVLGLTGVMVVSALVRLGLYLDSFGLSRLRVYTAAFVVWIAVLLGWFALTVVRGRRDRFATGAVVSAAAIVLLLNVINPDALIARVNVDHAIGGGSELDFGYLETLSADAAPVLAELATDVGDECLAGALGFIAISIDADGVDDWRSFHLTRTGGVDVGPHSTDLCGLVP